MHLEPQYAIEEGDLESVTYNILSNRLSEEDEGFGLREFEPTPILDTIQIGTEPPPVGVGGICCFPAPFSCSEGYDHATCDLIGGIWNTHYSNCDGDLGYAACDCHCLPCVGHESRISGPTHVSFDWSVFFPEDECLICDPPSDAGSVSNKPFYTPSTCPPLVPDGDGYYTSCWFYGTGFPSCDVAFSQFTNYPTSFTGISLQLTYYCGGTPCGDAPVGWYLTASYVSFESGCSAGCTDLYSCGSTCVYLGNEDVFVEDVDVPFSIDLTTGNCTGLITVGTVSGVLITNCIA